MAVGTHHSPADPTVLEGAGSLIPDVQQLSWPFPPLSDLASARKRPLLSSGPEPAPTFPVPHFLSRGLYADAAPPPKGWLQPSQGQGATPGPGAAVVSWAARLDALRQGL